MVETRRSCEFGEQSIVTLDVIIAVLKSYSSGIKFPAVDRRDRFLGPSAVSQHTVSTGSSASSTSALFFIRHEFAIRRLHSLTGIVPLGAYMVVHLLTNASLLNGVPTFQRAVMQIHSLGSALPIVEWGFIFLPLLFHAIVGVWIAYTAKYNTSSYRYSGNRRYVWQRWTGMIAFVFLMVHVFHLHGWFHVSYWLDYVAHPLHMANFRPYSAASTLAESMDSFLWPSFYFIGVMACVYHLANGLWTAGITWGLWVSPQAQVRATRFCLVFGVILAFIGAGAWWAAINVDVAQAIIDEDLMYEEAVRAKWVPDVPEKRRQPVSTQPISSVLENPAPVDSAADNSVRKNPVTENNADQRIVLRDNVDADSANSDNQ